jgi:deoxyribonuclease-4
MRLGAHIGISDGFDAAVHTAKKIGCETLQIFSKSPQMWKGAPISEESVQGFRAALAETGIRPTAIHHGYLLNLATPKRWMLKQSRKAFLEELERAEKLGADQLIFHPGAHLGSGTDGALKTLVESLNGALDETAGFKVRALLENGAGAGSVLCATIDELERVFDQVVDPRRLGVTLDTCHLFACGVDFRTEEGYGSLVDRIRSELGVKRIEAFHLNDAKAALGSKLDRHENIGKGEIGLEGFRFFVNDPLWKETPGYLETPLGEDDYESYTEDLRTLRGLVATPEDMGGPRAERGGTRIRKRKASRPSEA